MPDINNIVLVNSEATPAAEAKPTTLKDSVMGFLPLVLVFAIFYFFVIRPQMKKQKDHASLIKSVQKGDKVIAAGGLIGKVVKIKDDSTLILDIANKTEVEVLRSSVISVVDNKTPVHTKGSK